MKLVELFRDNPNIIINTDIDGFISGIILQQYCGAKVVGFSNSKKAIWVTPEIRSIYDPVYVDLFVARPDVVCIEQHVISFNKSHNSAIAMLGTKINPNVERCRTFSGDYYHKYPFGTVHYIVSCLGQEGIEVKFPDFSNICISLRGRETELGQIIMRADDALYSSLSAYADNAYEWWQYLRQRGDCPAIRQMVQYVQSCDSKKAKRYKEDVGLFFRDFGCDGMDGGFDDVMNYDGTLQKRVEDFYKFLKTVLKCGDVSALPSELILHEGVFQKSTMRRDSDVSVLSQKEMFSYAFIYGSLSRYSNFSYTTDMED